MPKEAANTMNVLLDFYKKIKFHTLDYIKRPFIFAFSAHIDEQVTKTTTKAGFDACISSPLTMKEFDWVINNFVEK